MNNRLSLGRYIPGNSALHRMDGRLKLVMILFLVGCIFAPQGFVGFFFLALVVALLFFVSHLRFNVLWRLFRPILFIFITLWFINCFLMTETGDFHDTGSWYYGKKPFFVSELGLLQACYITARILLMMTLTIILTSTTKPLVLTLSLEWLLSPLKLVRIPVHIIAIIMAIALRMVPTLVDEAGRIVSAQASRGVDFRNGRLREKFKAMVSLVIPLLVSSFQKAEDLAYAMDARGYDPHGKRTRYRQFRLTWGDMVLFVLFVGMGVALAVNTAHPFLNDFARRFLGSLQDIDDRLANLKG